MNIKSLLQMKGPLQLLATEEQWTSKIPNAAEWKLLEGLHLVLQLPLKVTTIWEKEEEPTINLVTERLVWLQNELDLLIQGDLNGRLSIFLCYLNLKCIFSVVKEVAIQLKERLSKRFPRYGTTTMLHMLGNYLDPVFRGVHLEIGNELDNVKKCH